MGRLIDADDIEFKKKFCKRFCTNLADVTTCKRKENCGIMEWIDEQPTAYDVDKIVEQLEDYGKHKGLLRITDNPANCDNYVPVREVKKIVKGAVKVE